MSEAAVRAYLREKHFSAATAERWLEQPEDDREGLLRLAERLRLGENQFRDFFDLLQEAAARRGEQIAAVLEEEPVRNVLARGLGRNDTIKGLKEALRRLRYPQLSAAERRLADEVNALGLPRGAQLQLPANLENTRVQLVIQAESAAELRQRIGRIAVLTESGALDEIFRILEGEA